jgi:hypothetical protein
MSSNSLVSDGLAAASMLPISVPDRSAAMLGRLNRLAIGVPIGYVHVPWPGWVVGPNPRLPRTPSASPPSPPSRQPLGEPRRNRWSTSIRMRRRFRAEVLTSGLKRPISRRAIFSLRHSFERLWSLSRTRSHNPRLQRTPPFAAEPPSVRQALMGCILRLAGANLDVDGFSRC